MTSTRGKQWLFTWNNYTDEDWVGLSAVDCVYMVAGREVAPETGMHHIQGYIVLGGLKSLKQMKALLSQQVHWEMARGNADQNFTYCSKEGDFVEYGVRPAKPGRKKGDQEEKWKEALELARGGGEQEDPMIAFVHGKLCKWHREQELQKRVLEDTEEQMLWYWGGSGTGKSRAARAEHPGAFIKNVTKWWCGYEEEDAVIIDDFDAAHHMLGHHLKIWGDRYPFMAENKGGARKIRPKVIIVTSNWHPKDIWTDQSTLGPILRRFKCVEFKAMEMVDNS